MKKTEKKIAKKRGRKRKYINKKKVENLINIGLSTVDIAKIIGVNESTIRRNFAEFLEKRKNKEIEELQVKKNRLRDAQWELAIEKMNPVMQVWLGKNYLGQSDKIETKENKKISLVIREIKRNE